MNKPTKIAKIFLTVPFKSGTNKRYIDRLSRIVRSAGFQDFCFIRDVENYQPISNPTQLMSLAKQAILSCDALLIDLTQCSTGRAIEAGVAFGAGKKIVIILKKGTKLKDTAKGIAHFIIEYDKLEDILQPLKKFRDTFNP
ncbi:MAG: hypothetical protein GXP43_01700 [bacterium]|nr:hypothetical protein [bacterium]